MAGVVGELTSPCVHHLRVTVRFAGLQLVIVAWTERYLRHCAEILVSRRVHMLVVRMCVDGVGN
jgi:hypothetical protein